MTIWLTGLSGAGKSTLAACLSSILERAGRRVTVLDGDEIRAGLSWDLGFSPEDRHTNARRIAYLIKLLERNDVIPIVAAVSPYRKDREEGRKAASNFVEIYVKCSLEVLITRDPKGLYRKALNGEITNFTGISDPYEEPLNPDILVETDKLTIDQSLNYIVERLEQLGYLDHQYENDKDW